MPLEYNVKMYGCKFKCGAKHTKHKYQMENHEKICWFNPANKTCKTCKHEEYYNDIDTFDHDDPYCSYVGEGIIRDCKIWKLTEKEIEKNTVYFDDSKAEVRCIMPKVNCQYWEEKEI